MGSARRSVSLRGCVAGALLAACGLSATGAVAREAAPRAADPALEAQVQAISQELRCLVCQNETIAASHSALAVDLRGQVARQLTEGRTPQQIRDYMVERYGDFVLYRPVFGLGTALLWIGPFVLLAGALAALVVTLRRRGRAPAGAAPPDEAALQRARRLLEGGGAGH